MPELPEVEVVRRGLDAHVVGHTFRAVRVLHPRPVRRYLPGPGDFEARLTGRTVEATRRRGKFLWLPLDSGDALLAHLGMSGQFRVSEPDAPAEPHLRVRFELEDGRELRFVDQRMFGGVSIALGGAELPDEVAHIARDPLDPAFDDAGFAEAVRGRTTNIKRALLDQRLISGVGNIYADEALWRARLHFARPTRTMRRPEVVRLLAAVRAVMNEAIAVGGTSFDALYVDVNGESGTAQANLNVYGRQGLPCTRCGTSIVRERFMNRSSHICLVCQRKR